ncbi:MAG: hypothetical protein IKI49_05575, partial [Oscillospiraceae bacterium]|nr:hypothetical protein [Oscillospiraceae bacterium]
SEENKEFSSVVSRLGINKGKGNRNPFPLFVLFFLLFFWTSRKRVCVPFCRKAEKLPCGAKIIINLNKGSPHGA